MRGLLSVVAFFCLGLVGACGFPYKALSAGPTGCLPDEMEVQGLAGGGGYRTWLATCHGQTFVCTYVGQGSPECSPRRARSREVDPVMLEALRNRRAEREVEYATGSNAEIIATRAALQSGRALFSFTIGPGDVGVVHIKVESRTPTPLRNCDTFSFSARDETVTGTLTEGRVDLPFDGLSEILAQSRPLARFCGLEWYPTPSDRAFLRRLFESRVRIGTGGRQEEAPEAEPEAESAEDSLRGQLQNSAAVLHACTSTGEPIRVDVSWTEQGTVTLSLPGQDASVTGCAQAAVQLNVPEGAAAGDLVHVVR